MSVVIQMLKRHGEKGAVISFEGAVFGSDDTSWILKSINMRSPVKQEEGRNSKQRKKTTAKTHLFVSSKIFIDYY